jgi:DNA-binding NarL/FixJ family response regulator
METIRILLADDHPRFREGVRLMLRREPELEIVGEASAGDEAVALAAAHQPDVVLMDLQMPGINGVEATRQIVETSPHIRVLVLTMYEMLRAIRGVASGEAIFGPTIAHRLVQYFAAHALP